MLSTAINIAFPTAFIAFLTAIITLALADMRQAPRKLQSIDPLLEARRKRLQRVELIVMNFYLGRDYRLLLLSMSDEEMRLVESDLTIIAASWSHAVADRIVATHPELHHI